ncbi:MAG: hypothetical protein HYU75_23765, partial [Betaproteobacteria bacterium]|nr:hypothetical protein [Betaproteobacteria bacterium]
AEAGYLWHGDVFDDDLPYVQNFDGRKIVAIPLGTDVNDMPFMKYGNAPAMMLESFKQNVEVAQQSGELAIIDVTCHAHIYGHPRGAHFYGKIIAAAAGCKDVWIARRIDIANHVLAQEQAKRS